ncbi:D-alanyl-D-alanine carboxypeptidase precursor [Microbulbifer aggregans]|uniref:D-alanyl-D-alanine carboxypeptidase n=1 Tax=Microbulbifer aggregans TaxID=1769779 RepID=A0A1C9W4J1_9GAMM|nr:serine hydrolase [Microbulbifer aggregans]AOS96067.1 D-alanyl-D-alanine carboxypeptidase precursor [Microbulbifer aggregans]
MRTLFSLRLFTVIAFVFTAGVTSANEFQSGLQSTLEREFSRLKGVPGVAVGVATPDQGTVFAGAGVGNTLTGSPVSAADQFRIASISKVFTGAMVLKLQEQGYLNIDDRLIDHLFIPGLPYGDVMTIRQLLNHSAGVYDHINGSNNFWSLALDDPYRIWDSSEIVQYAIDGGALAAPGTAYNYSNTGTYILGMLIEAKTGLSLSAAVDQMVSVPLQLPGLFLDDWSNPQQKIVGLAENDRAYEFHKSGIGAAGAMVAPAEQLAAFGRSVYGANFLPSELTEMMTAPSLRNSSYGLTTRIWSEATYGYLHFGHTGTLSGYSSILMYVPDQDVAIGILSNGYARSSSSWYTLIDEIFNYVTSWYASNGSGACTIPEADDIIIDNADTAMNVSGSWQTDSRGKKHYGADYLTDGNAQKGELVASYQFSAPGAGVWELMEYHPASRDQATQTPVTVIVSGGAQSFVIDQSAAGSSWNSLGQISLLAGQDLEVALSNNGTDGTVVADAFRLRFSACPE